MENHWKSTDEWAALEGVPAKDEESLNAVGMRMVGDLLDWFPRRYEDRRHFDAFPAAAKATVASCRACGAPIPGGPVRGACSLPRANEPT